eukprot:295077-Rhodomonas_salina.3
MIGTKNCFRQSTLHMRCLATTMCGADRVCDASGGNYGATTTFIAETEAEVAAIEKSFASGVGLRRRLAWSRVQALEATCLMCPAAAARFFRALAMYPPSPFPLSLSLDPPQLASSTLRALPLSSFPLFSYPLSPLQQLLLALCASPMCALLPHPLLLLFFLSFGSASSPTYHPLPHPLLLPRSHFFPASLLPFRLRCQYLTTHDGSSGTWDRRYPGSLSCSRTRKRRKRRPCA